MKKLNSLKFLNELISLINCDKMLYFISIQYSGYDDLYDVSVYDKNYKLIYKINYNMFSNNLYDMNLLCQKYKEIIETDNKCNDYIKYLYENDCNVKFDKNVENKKVLKRQL